MRAMLEGWAMELAASRITAEELDQMRSLLPKMDNNNALQSATAFQGYNRDFHWTAIEACGKPHLIDMLRRLWDLMLPYSLAEKDSELTVESRNKGDIERQQQSHQELVGALAAGDCPAARAVLAKHSEETMKQVRMGAKRLNQLHRRENGRVFVQPLLPIRTSLNESQHSGSGAAPTD